MHDCQLEPSHSAQCRIYKACIEEHNAVQVFELKLLYVLLFIKYICYYSWIYQLEGAYWQDLSITLLIKKIFRWFYKEADSFLTILVGKKIFYFVLNMSFVESLIFLSYCIQVLENNSDSCPFQVHSKSIQMGLILEDECWCTDLSPWPPMCDMQNFSWHVFHSILSRWLWENEIQGDLPCQEWNSGFLILS